MLNKIVLLEETFNSLLVTRHAHVATPANLIEAGNNWSLAVWDAALSTSKIHFTEQQIEDALAFSQQAIFVCGSERSGTTLIRDLLDAHPQLSVLPSEGTYITNQEKQLLALPLHEHTAFLCREWLWRLVTSMHHPPYFLLGRSSYEHSPYVDFARAFIAWWPIAEKKLSKQNSLWPFIALQWAYATALGKLNTIKDMYWVEKTPYNEMNMQRLWQEFPQAKFIQAIRNPIDVIKSRKPLEKVSTVSLTKSIRFLYQSFVIAKRQKNNDDKKYMLIKYEELCEQPEKIAMQMASFIGIDFHNILLTPTVTGKPTQPNSSFTQGIAAGKVMKQKEHVQESTLSKEELLLLAAYLYRPAAKFGYQLQPIGILQQQYIKAKVFVQRAMGRIKRAFTTKH